MYDGTLKFDTSLDASGMQKGANKLGDIVKGLGIFELLKKGVEMVAASVGQAMSRIDTMDQFNRVMSTMTGSVSETNKALTETTAIVTGTAYGLDTAAKGVQAFVSAGMKVSAATDTMKAWADATSFYTKGTNAELETVSGALQKMQTKGTVTMEHLQMLLEAGIPAIQIYASAVGMSTEEVTNQMSKGELKTSDFIKVMNAAFETGTSGFPSVAGAAQKAGQSWSGSIDNMKAAIARGTASVLTSFDKMFNVKSGIVSFGKTLEKVFKGIADNLTFIVPTAIAATTAIVALKVAKSVSSGISALSTAFKVATAQAAAMASGSTAAASALVFQTTAEKALTGITTIGNVIKAAAKTVALAMTGATWAEAAATAGLTGAWAALNAVILASPLGWILLAIVAVTAAIAGICNAVKNANKEYYAEKDALKDLKEEHEGYADALQKSKDSAREEAQEKVAQAQTNRDLLYSLAALVDENGVYSGSAEDARRAVSNLNSNIDGLGLAFDETTGKVGMSAEELRAYGDNLEAVAQYEAAQSEYNNLLSEQHSLQAKINALEEKKKIYKDMLDAGTLSQYQYNKLTKEADKLAADYGDSMSDLKVDVEAYGRAAQKAADSEAEIAVTRQNIIDNQMDQVKKYAETYNISTDQILDEASKMTGGLDEWASEAEKTYASVIVAKQDYVEQIKAGNVQIDASYAESLENRRLNGEELNDIEQAYLEQWKSINQEAIDHYKGQQQEIVDAAKNTKGEIILSEQQSATERLEIQRANNEATAAYVENYNSIWARIPVEHRRYLADMTIEDARFLQDIASTWDKGGSDQWDQYVAGIQEGIATSEQLVQGSAEEYGANVVGAANAGAQSKVPEFGATGAAASDEFSNALAASTSPDAASQAIAGTVVKNLTSADYSGITTGIANAVKAGTGGVTTALGYMSENIVNKVKMAQTRVENIARNMMTGISTAISSGASAVTAAAESVTSGIASKFNAMISGAQGVVRQMFSGMSSAMDEYAPALYSKARTIANEITKTLKSAFQIHSPSRVTFGIFKNVMLGAYNAMDEGMGDLIALAGDMSGGIRLQMADIPESVMVDMSNQMRSAIAGTRSDIASGMAVSVQSQGLKYATPQLIERTKSNTIAPTVVVNNNVDADVVIRKLTRDVARGL